MTNEAMPVWLRLSAWLRRFLASSTFFYLTIGFFVFQAVWIALSARYPMAFDEQFHLGIIQLYAHQKGPFFSHQPAGADVYGAVARDPSYLYHYLMSFPYRLLTHLTHSFTVQVVTLRLINVAIFSFSIPVFRRILRLGGASPLLANTVMAIFCMLPVVPLLASQINYDNLLVLVSAVAILWTVQFLQRLQNGVLAINKLVWLGVLCLFASLVKYAFLPLFAAIVLCIGVALWLRRSELKILSRVAFKQLSRRTMIVAGIFFLLSSLGLFIERYGVNTWRYHTPIPECNQVLSVAECESYSPWARNYEFLQFKTTLPWWHSITYIGTWVRSSLTEIDFTITSRANALGDVDYYGLPPLPILYEISWAVFVVGTLALVFYFRRLWHNMVTRVVMITSGVYVLALFAQNYLDYHHLGQPIAIHGRYLIPVMPFILLIYAYVISWGLSALFRRSQKLLVSLRPLALSSLLLIFFIEGGGFVSFVSLSRSDWFWPQNQRIMRINYTARQIISPLVVGN